MSELVTHNAVPRWAVLAGMVVVVGTLLSVATVRLSGTEVRAPDAAAVSVRQLRFEDRPDGSVAVFDASQPGIDIELDRIHGEAGFLRGSLRALARERGKRGIGSGPAFELIARADGRLTLYDPATEERIDLESFGPTNAAVYARLLALRAPMSSTASTAPTAQAESTGSHSAPAPATPSPQS
jgi:putative photosynthetic complex assembly protein